MGSAGVATVGDTSAPGVRSAGHGAAVLCLGCGSARPARTSAACTAGAPAGPATGCPSPCGAAGPVRAPCPPPGLHRRQGWGRRGACVPPPAARWRTGPRRGGGGRPAQETGGAGMAVAGARVAVVACPELASVWLSSTCCSVEGPAPFGRECWCVRNPWTRPTCFPVGLVGPGGCPGPDARTVLPI